VSARYFFLPLLHIINIFSFKTCNNYIFFFFLIFFSFFHTSGIQIYNSNQSSNIFIQWSNGVCYFRWWSFGNIWCIKFSNALYDSSLSLPFINFQVLFFSSHAEYIYYTIIFIKVKYIYNPDNITYFKV
jgi:hypothetical protein